MTFLEMYLLAMAGFLFHLSKVWLSALDRKEQFITQKTIVWIGSNLLAALILVYIAPTLPPDLFVVSPLSVVLIGFFNSSMLGGFINTKRPKNAEEIALMGDDGDGDTGGSNPPPDKPKPPVPPGGGQP